LEHTSDITGGKGKHAVLTGHSGLSLNKLFTDLPKVKKGDDFYIKVNGEVHAYKVDQIKTVLPTNMKYLKVDPNKDYVTLVTCTPLFVNTHRLLV
ncbi:sortase, partial [Lactobacillus salivarius]|nr:sortase [Ligilactobacillus salivarius]